MKILRSVKFSVTFSVTFGWLKFASVIFAAFSVTFLPGASDFSPFFDGAIFPAPARFEPTGKVGVSASGVTLAFEGEVGSAKAIRALLEKRLSGVEGGDTPVKIAFSKAGELEPEEYCISATATGGAALFRVRGGSDRALYYAAATLAQMIDREHGEMLTAEVRDNPVWRERCVADFFLPKVENLPEFLAQWKINEVAVQTANSWRDIAPDAKMQWGPYPTVREMLTAFSAWYEENGGLVELLLAPRIYGHGGRNRIDCSNDFEVAELASYALNAARCHVHHIMLRADDVVPEVAGEYRFTSPEEAARFKSLGEAHGHLVSEVAKKVWSEFPDVVISFCPGPYTIDAHRATGNPAREYLADLAAAMPEKAYIVWTGRDVVSPAITPDDVALYEELVSGHRTFVWHNTEISARTLALPRTLRFYPGLSADCGGIFFANAEGTGKERNRPADLAMCALAWNQPQYGGLETYAEAAFKLKGVDKLRYKSLLENIIALEDALLAKPDKLALLEAADAQAAEFENAMDMRWFRSFYNIVHAALTAATPEVSLPRGSLTIVPDGNLNEEVWTLRAEKSELVKKDGSPAGKSALFYYNEADDVLFLALEFERGVELKFLPVGERTCNISLNAAGEVATFYHWVIEWRPELEAAVAARPDGGYTAELAIPLDAFRSATLPPDHRITPGEAWKLQIRCDDDFFSAPNPNDPDDLGIYGTIKF